MKEKQLLEDIQKKVTEHDKLTEKLAVAISRQNLVIAGIGVIGTVLMFTLGQLFPLFLEILKSNG